MTQQRLPDWAEEWVSGRCGCGARLCRVACYCGGHIVCSVAGRDPDACAEQRKSNAGGTDLAVSDMQA